MRIVVDEFVCKAARLQSFRGTLGATQLVQLQSRPLKRICLVSRQTNNVVID